MRPITGSRCSYVRFAAGVLKDCCIRRLDLFFSPLPSYFTYWRFLAMRVLCFFRVAKMTDQ